MSLAPIAVAFLSPAVTTALANKQPLDATLTALAGLATGADKVPYSTGTDAFSQATLTAAARTVIDDTTVAAMVDTLGGASATGSGGLVRATSATLVAPALGTPTALVGTNISGTAASLTAGNVTTNANLTGPITSSGNATSVAAQTGTGSTFAMSASPALTGTPTAPTASNGTNTTQIATTAFVLANAATAPNDAARAENSSNISIPDATPTALTFDTQIFDTTGIFDAGGDTGKITFVKSGYYTVGGEADLSIGAGRRIIYIQKNGSSIIALNDYTNGSVGIEHRCINGIDHFTAGDYIQVLVYQENGSSIDVLGGSFRTPAIWAHILSAG